MLFHCWNVDLTVALPALVQLEKQVAAIHLFFSLYTCSSLCSRERKQVQVLSLLSHLVHIYKWEVLRPSRLSPTLCHQRWGISTQENKHTYNHTPTPTPKHHLFLLLYEHTSTHRCQVLPVFWVVCSMPERKWALCFFCFFLPHSYIVWCFIRPLHWAATAVQGVNRRVSFS